MARVLIAFGTTEGHTRKVATRLSEWLTEGGNTIDLVDLSTSTSPSLDLGSYDGIILAGSVHQGKHQSSLIHFTKSHVKILNTKLSAFLSISLSAVGKDDSHQSDARKCVDVFTTDTGWHPTESLCVAGALLYTQYDYFKRLLMKMIAKSQGGGTDTSQDFEYTNWDELKDFTKGFVASLS